MASFMDLIKAEVADEIGELVALLQYSELPTLLVEYPSDVRIYNRWIEQRLFGTYKVDVLAVGGRDNLLNLYKRRNEFADLPVAFVANQGMWLFSGIPEAYEDIIWTDGYSIENDIYSESRIENLVHSDKSTEFFSVRESIITWFASEVEKFPEGNFQGINPDLDKLVPKGQTELDQAFHKGLHFVKSEITNDIRAGYRLKLPGKLLFQMVARFSDISPDGLYNTALVDYEAEPQELIEKIRRNLGKHESKNQASPKQHGRDQNKRLLNPTLESDLSVVDNSAKNLTSTSESDLSVDKFVDDLTSADTPIVVVEGKDSADIIKKLIKHEKPGTDVEVQHISGRDRLLAVYDRRDEFAHILPVAFVIDREMWLFSGIPDHYTDIIYTKGYSLENDLYIDGGLENLIDPHEKWKHGQVLNATIKWFAFEVEEFLSNGRSPEIDDDKLSEIVLPAQLELNKKFCRDHEFREPPDQRIQEIKRAYKHLLPGKYLFQILERFLNTHGRSFNYDVNVHGLHDIVPMVPEVKVEDIINAKIIKNDGTKVTVQLTKQPLYNLIQRIYQTLQLTSEEITFEWRHYPGQVGDEHEMRVISVDRGRVKEVAPLQVPQRFAQSATSVNFPSEVKQVKEVTPLQQEVKVGDKINAKIIKKEKEGFKVTVQMETDNKEEITFAHPYFPGQIGDEKKLKVTEVDSTGRVKKVAL